MKALKLLGTILRSEHFWMVATFAVLIWQACRLVGTAQAAHVFTAFDAVTIVGAFIAVSMPTYWAGRESRDPVIKRLADAHARMVDRWIHERDRNRLMVDDVLMAAASGLPVKSLTSVVGGMTEPELDAAHGQEYVPVDNSPEFRL